MALPFIPVIAGVLLTGLRQLFFRFLGYMVANGPAMATNLLLGIGFYFVVAKPVGYLVYNNFIISSFSGVPGNVLATLYYINTDDYLQMIFSAYAARHTMHAGRMFLRRKTGQIPGGNV